MVAQQLNIHWFRRDLRLDDNHAFYSALQTGLPVLPVFIFDTSILEELPQNDKRVSIIYNRIIELNTELKKFGSSIFVGYGKPLSVFSEIIDKYSVSAVFSNEDYEPYAIERDQKITALLKEKGIAFYSCTDQVLIHPEKVKKKDGTPYSIFTPWYKKWLQKIDHSTISEYPSENYLDHLFKIDNNIIDIREMGFENQEVLVNTHFPDNDLLRNYEEDRNYPAKNGTSQLSVALRFGMISIRQLVKKTFEHNVFLNELAWREFYMMILYHFPKVVTNSFKSQYENIPWRNNEDEFERWKNGETGYLIVDAGMRELYETGYMHNRVRMITAGFLTKHLLIDWRWGESWFAEKLLDYELASNNGGWQWAAGTGCDAAPYFRIFNPVTQLKKFDPEFKYVRKWVPEFDSFNYLEPIVEHKFARERSLITYKKVILNID